MALDPPLVPSIVVKNAIENQVPAIEDVISPAPITVQLDGVRVKLNYDKYHELIENVVIEGKNYRIWLKLKNLSCMIIF